MHLGCTLLPHCLIRPWGNQSTTLISIPLLRFSGAAAGSRREVLRIKRALCRGDLGGALNVSICWIGLVAFWWHSPQSWFSAKDPCQKSTYDLVNLIENSSFSKCAFGRYFVASLSDQCLRQPKYHSDFNSSAVLAWRCCWVKAGGT